MGLYEKYLLPKLLNAAMKSPDFTRLRTQLIPMAKGKVLELGIGSGLNLPFYDKDARITGVDPSIELQVYAQEVAASHAIHVEFIPQTAEDLPFGDHTFDCVVMTWTLCSIQNPDAALAEIRRVLKPAGRLIFAEHGRSPEAQVEKWQNRLNPLWRIVGGGCNLNRQPDQSLLNAGFNFEQIEAGYLDGPKWATYNYRGVAKLA